MEEVVFTPEQEELSLISGPGGWAMSQYGMDWLYQWEFDALESLEPKFSTACLKTINGAGKTSVLCCVPIFWHMNMFPGSLVVYISASNRQIKEQLLPSIKEIRGKFHADWKIKEGNEIKMTGPDDSRCLMFSTDNPGLSEGFHPQGIEDEDLEFEKELLLIFDEMKSISDITAETARVRCRWTRHLNVSSPGLKRGGAFYENFRGGKELFKDNYGRVYKGTTIPGYNLWVIGMDDCPHMKKDARQWRRFQVDIARLGRDHPIIKSSYFAEDPDKGERAVYNMASVDRAMSGINRKWGEDRRAAVDLSGGRNETVLGVRVGNMSKIVWTSHETNTIFLADELIRKFRWLQSEFGITSEEIWADEGGLGRPIIQYINLKGWHLNFFRFGDKANDNVNYANARAEMNFELAERLDFGECIIEHDDKLRDQFEWIQWEQYHDRQIKLVPKEKMPDSPDRVDVIAMLYYRSRRYHDVERVAADLDQRLSKTITGEPWRVEKVGEQGQFAELQQPEGLFY